MKILIVTQYFWPESFRINDLALGLKERGHEVTVLTGMPNYPTGHFFHGYHFLSPKKEFFHDIPVLRVPLVPRGNGQRWRLAMNFISFAFCASLLAPFRCRGKFDAIFVYEPSPITVGIPALVLKKLKSIPIFFWVQDLWPESLSATGAIQSKWVLNSVKHLVRFIYRRCDRVLVQSEGFIPHVTAVGADPKRVVYFPNWAESLYVPIKGDRDGIDANDLPKGFRVLFAGNIGHAQSFETFLDAAQRLGQYPHIQWIVLGDGHRRIWLEEQIAIRGLSFCVHLLGKKPAEHMPRYFASADVLLVMLRKDPFFAATIPSKVQSYLACGRPIIASLEGTGAEVIKNAGAGIVCEPGDGESLANAVLDLSERSKSERSFMADQARHYYECHFERNMLLNRLETIFLQNTLKDTKRTLPECVS